MRRLLVLLVAVFALGCAVGIGAAAVSGRLAADSAPAPSPGTAAGLSAASGSVSADDGRPGATPTSGRGLDASASPAPPSTSPSTSPGTPAGPPGAAPSPQPTPYRGPMTRTVPVLMYHSIADPPPGAPYPGLYVAPAAFDAQMHALRDAGWQSITAGELGADMAANVSVPVRTIVIMFDDGYEDNYTTAFPILERYGLRATFSVVARGGTHMMTSSQLAAMASAGMEIGNHTLDHRNVSRLSGPPLVGEIEGGAARIEARLASQGVTVVPTTFVYPSGHVGPAALALLASLHYTDAFTEVPGFAVIGQTPPLQIPRLRVSRFDSLAAFLAQLPVEPRP